MRSIVIHDPRLKPILADASAAYRRRDDEAFLAFLEEAINRAPQRMDLRFNLASHHIQTGKPEAALEIYRNLSLAVPGDVETLFHLAHWRRYFSDVEAAEEIRARLAATRPEVAEDLKRIWDIIGSWQAEPISDALPGFMDHVADSAIVALGYELETDGGMRGMLVERLEKTLEAAERYPDAAIVVSGGVPRAGRVEAAEMRRWLTEAGVDEGRIYEEGYARDVVENLVYARQIVDIMGVDAILVVTSAIDVRRAGAILQTLAWVCGSRWDVAVVAASGPSFTDFRDDGRDRLKLYRDVPRAYGVPMMRTYPELAER